MDLEGDKFLEQARSHLLKRGFILDEVLGAGTFGTVVQVDSINKKQKYAIKITRSSNGESDKERQERELELLKNHNDDLWERNILRYYHSWQNEINNRPCLFIQTELCLESLETFIFENTIAAGPQIVRITSPKPLWAQVFPQILNGLDALHEIGWAHRDIHPGNILIAHPRPRQIREISVKIADFCCAREISFIPDTPRRLDDLPDEPALSFGVGQELFRAPEVATARYDHKVDLYSAGIVLYILSCYLPDKSKWADEIKKLKNKNRDWEDLSHRDEILYTMIDRLIKENPDERPTAAQAIQYMEGKGKGLEDLSHQEKINEISVNLAHGLVKEDPNKRPNAVEALKYTKDDSKGHTERKFLAKKRGDEIYYRCTTTDDSLEELKVALQEHTYFQIKANAQILIQEETVDDEKIQVAIISDENVRDMFRDAEKLGKKLRIIVGEDKGQAIETDLAPVRDLDS